MSSSAILQTHSCSGRHPTSFHVLYGSLPDVCPCSTLLSRFSLRLSRKRPERQNAMNKPLDPKDLVNPFVVPTPLSLHDVFNSIRETELPTARKRDLLSALRRVQRFTGTP